MKSPKSNKQSLVRLPDQPSCVKRNHHQIHDHLDLEVVDLGNPKFCGSNPYADHQQDVATGLCGFDVSVVEFSCRIIDRPDHWRQGTFA